MEQYREDIEHLSSAFSEKDGLPPVCGRIVNYLFLKPDCEATFDELTEYFDVSKSAVSNGLKILENNGVVHSRTKNGQRKRYFYITANVEDIIQNVNEKLTKSEAFLSEVIATRKSDNEMDKKLCEMKRFVEQIIKRLPVFLQKFKQENKIK